MLSRTLEPEVMDTADEAREYNRMDHSQVNQLFVTDLLSFAEQVWNERGHIGNAEVPDDEIDDEIEQEPISYALGDVLDVGTGTALIPVELCKRHPFCRVMATDMAVNMLNLAVYNIELAGIRHRVTLTQSDAKEMIFRDGMFDVVMSNSIIHHLPEPIEALREMVRVLRPGGILFVRDLMRPHDLATLEQLVETYTGNESELSQKLFSDSLHAALSLDEIGELAQQVGLAAETVQATSDRHWTLSAVS